MARRPNPLVPLGLFRRRQFATINLSTLLIYGAAVHDALHPGPVPAGRRRLHGDRGRAHRRCRPGSCSRCSRRGSGRWPAASARGGSSSPGRSSWRSACCGSRGFPPTRAPWQLAIGDPTTYLPPASTLVDILPMRPAVRVRAVARRRAADEHAHVVRAGRQRGARVGDQQLDPPGRPAAPVGGDLRRRLRVVLRVARRVACRASTRTTRSSGPRSSRSTRRPRARRRTSPQAATEASVDALRLAVVVCAALLAAGALTNGIGLRSQGGEEAEPRRAANASSRASTEPATVG